MSTKYYETNPMFSSFSPDCYRRRRGVKRIEPTKSGTTTVDVIKMEAFIEGFYIIFVTSFRGSNIHGEGKMIYLNTKVLSFPVCHGV